MIGKIIVFRFPGSEQKSLNQFCKKFYGQETSSHSGKYRYRKKGLLDSIPHIKPVGGVIVDSNGNADKLIQVLKDYSTEFFVRDVILLPEDGAILSRAVSIYYFVPKPNYGADTNDQTKSPYSLPR